MSKNKINEPVNLTAGILRKEIAHLISSALSSCNMQREDVATNMSILLGRKISKHMLDAYASKSRTEHIPPLDVSIAFDIATNQNTLSEYFVGKLGGKLLTNDEISTYSLGKVTKEKELLLQKEKNIKIVNGIISDDFNNKILINILEEESTTFQLILAWLIANCDSDKGLNFLRDQAFELEETEASKQKYEHSIATLDSIRELALSWQKTQQRK